MSPGSAPSPPCHAGSAVPLSIASVLREASAILRRHWATCGGLALACAVLPDLLSEPAADTIKAALPIAQAGSLLGDAMDLARALVDVSADMLPVFGGLVLDVAVIVIALGPQELACRASADAPSIVFRILPWAVPTFVVAFGWIVWAPALAFVSGSALISCWILLLPIAAAEAVGPARVPRRLRSLTRGNRRRIAGLLAGYLVLYVVLGEIQLDLPAPFADGTSAAWAIDAVQSSLVAALAVLADVTAVALYLAMRRVEAASASTEVVAAFE